MNTERVETQGRKGQEEEGRKKRTGRRGQEEKHRKKRTGRMIRQMIENAEEK